MMGLSSIQLFVLIGIVGLTIVICTAVLGLKLLTTIVTTGIIILPLVAIAAKLNKEHKKGCPNYVLSYYTFLATPKKIIDKKGVLSMIYQEK